MADDSSKYDLANGVIDVHVPRDLKYWADKFDVSEESVRDTVFRVGPNVIDVRRALDR
jgi:hypothetical protein